MGHSLGPHLLNAHLLPGSVLGTKGTKSERHSSCSPAQPAFLFFFFFSCFLGLHPQHMEVPRLQVESEIQLLTYTRATATCDLSHICDLHHSSQCCSGTTITRIYLVKCGFVGPTPSKVKVPGSHPIKSEGSWVPPHQKCRFLGPTPLSIDSWAPSNQK